MKPRLILLISFSLLTSLVILPLSLHRGSAQTAPTWQGQIAYLGSDGNVWVQNSQSPQPYQVTADASEQRRYYSPRFSPGGDLMAYCRNDDGGAGGSKLFLVRTGAWQPILLVEDVFCQGYPQRGFDWSPDGSSIVYTRSFEYSPQTDGRQWSRFHGIWSVDIVSGEAEELVPPPGTNPLVYPLWSPDGRWIRMYELVFQEGLGVLRTWNRESGALYNWLGLGSDLFPGSADWSPDSNRLVFDQVTYVGYPGAGLFTASPDVTGLQQVFADPGRGVVQPLWSPKGDSLAFQLLTYYRNEQASLVLSAPDGSNLQEVFQTQASLVLLDWSPNGNQLLFVSNDSGQAGLYIYDLQSAMRIPVVEPSGWSADWAVLPKDGGIETSGQPVEIEGFEASGGSILSYLAENYQLWLLDPANGNRAEISPPLSAVTFWVSPSGQRLIYADRLLTLEFQTGGSLSVQSSMLPNIPVGEQIHWSPDEKRFSYQDAQGRVWLVDSGGSFVEIPGASGLPDWSSDGRFISYCTGGEQLWVVGGGISLREVASPVDCAVAWSSSQPLLAYTLNGSSGPDSDQVYIYEAETGKSSLALESSRLVGWSQDGAFLAMKRSGKGGSSQYTLFAIDPQHEKLLEVGEVSSNAPGLQGWADLTQDYILGPYQLSPELNNSDRIADVLYDVTSDGQVLLIGDQDGSRQEVICLDMEGGEPTTLLSATLSGIPSARRPGIWAQLSPLGDWTSAYFYDSGTISYLLTRCDRQRQATLEISDDSFGDSFSTDSRWYVQHVPGESRSGQVLLYNLATLNREMISALSASPVLWIDPPEGVIENQFSLNGQVFGADGQPEGAVNIIVDGQPAATSEQDGSFELTSLTAGEHTISALKGELVFSPSEYSVTVPDEAEQLLFTVLLNPQQQEEAGSGDKQVTQPVQDTETSPAVGSVDSGASTDASNVMTTNDIWIWGVGIALVIFLLVVLVFRIIRRRRKTDQSPEVGETAQAESKSAAGQASAMLKLGVEQVKLDQNAEGRRTLDEVLKSDPQNAVAWLWSGMAATKMKNWRAAERSFKEARKLGHPKADEALIWLKEKRSKG